MSRAWSTSTAPAVTIAAAASPAAVFDATTETPALSALPAAAEPAPAAPAAAAPPADMPPWAIRNFLSSSSGPTGKTAASALFVEPSCFLKVEQRSQPRRWRRTGGLMRRMPSDHSPSSSRTSSQVSLRDSAASASETRARTSSDLTEGTVVSIASAICS